MTRKRDNFLSPVVGALLGCFFGTAVAEEAKVSPRPITDEHPLRVVSSEVRATALAERMLVDTHDHETALKDVRGTLDSFHNAAADANFEAYFDLFSKEGVFIGTDAGERWTVDAFREFVKPYFSQGKGWTYVPRDRTVVIHGDVAWFDELLDNPVYGECRGSGVLVKENGEWKIAQYNLHFPIPNDLAKQITAMIKQSRKK
ncbi:nuclear transport factor 2 family protein [Microbulbifer pacificus]|uniref:nuclear transport factor 2 family protein n=1 Tax=Microbulbifer pacificus TaxID=407164 RepID=UPI001F46D126|nr:nuclear transport factor 2 family protein [Microbulbifer pacificus]